MGRTGRLSLDSLEEIAEQGWPFTTWTLDKFQDYQPPVDSGILENGLGDILIDEGTDIGIVGPPGVGKSRLALQLAIAQITGSVWAGLPTRWPARRWLYVGNENSIRRQRMDLLAMAEPLNDKAQDLLRENLFMHVQGERDDHVISMGNETAVNKWELTLKHIQPDVLLIDPFEALLENADANDSGDVRRSMNKLSGLVREYNQNGIIIFVHHARTGAQAAAGALGFDRNNYAKGSKSFTGIVRVQINVCPAARDEPGRIAIECGKANDCRPFLTQGLILNQETMAYDSDPDFDPEALGAILAGREPPIKVTMEEITAAITAGKTRYKDIVAAIRDSSGATSDAVRSRLQQGVSQGTLNMALGIYSVAA
jgi:hypothetical protein